MYAVTNIGLRSAAFAAACILAVTTSSFAKDVNCNGSYERWTMNAAGLRLIYAGSVAAAYRFCASGKYVEDIVFVVFDDETIPLPNESTAHRCVDVTAKRISVNVTMATGGQYCCLN